MKKLLTSLIVVFSLSVVLFSFWPTSIQPACDYVLPPHWQIVKNLNGKYVVMDQRFDDVIGYWRVSIGTLAKHDVNHVWHYAFDDSCMALGQAKLYFESQSYKEKNFK